MEKSEDGIERVGYPNDAFFKDVFSQPRHATAFFKSRLPPAIVAQVDWSSPGLKLTAKELRSPSDAKEKMNADAGIEHGLDKLNQEEIIPDVFFNPWNRKSRLSLRSLATFVPWRFY